jgi:hypothetical protein
MKFKQLAILGLAIAIAAGTIGCQIGGNNTPSSQVELKETHGVLSEKVNELIHTQAELSVIAKTIETGISSAESPDADSAVLLYVKYADSKSGELASKTLYSTPEISEKFYKVFGEEFKYQWDERKIGSISDNDLKIIFNDLNKAYMKVEVNGQYLGPAVNYQKISELPNLSEAVRKFYLNVDGLYSTGRLANQLKGLDYAATAQYAAVMEDTYMNAEDLTLKESASSMLSFALNLYYTGTEGSSPFDFEKKTLSESFVTSTKEVIKKYDKYHIGILGKQYLEMSDANNGELTSDFADLVINYKKFGFDSKKSVTSNKVVKEPNYFEITPVFTGFENHSIEEKVANEIATAVGQIKETVKWEKTEKTNYHLSYIVDYASDTYFSLQLSGVSYNQENSVNLYDNVSLIFDSKTGEKITLKDIFKEDYDKNMKKVKELVLKDINENQKLTFKTTKDIVIDNNVMLDPNYLMVTFKKGSYSDEQQYDIVTYVPYSQLLDTFDMNAYLRGK